MKTSYRLFVLVLLLGGIVISILSGTDICTFGGCNEAHKYRLYGFPFYAVGLSFFVTATLAVLLLNRIPIAQFMYNLLLAGASGAEINMILLQKDVIGLWCPLCVAAAIIVYILAACQIARYIKTCKEEFQMNLKSLGKPLLIFVTAMIGFTITFTGMAKEEVSAAQLDLYTGKKESKIEVLFFSDWFCPYCSKVEEAVEAVYPDLAKKTKILFVDKVIHQESLNFVPYHLSFEAYEKAKIMQLRKALFSVAQRTKNPSYEEIKTAIAPLGVNYRQLSFLEVTQQMGNAQRLAEQYKVVSTPTMVVRNLKTGKTTTLVGNGQITPAGIMKAVKDLE
jgi:protein-disulfide isomerase